MKRPGGENGPTAPHKTGENEAWVARRNEQRQANVASAGPGVRRTERMRAAAAAANTARA